MTLSGVLCWLYENEINAEVSCFWDGGWDVKIGDDMNGWRAIKNFESSELETKAPQWLEDTAREIYPFVKDRKK